ncbi:hypothetical protein R5W23_001711 [Gemmata sp. JC673]|uniref:Uncharacterized protein n=1 Tax=Gemmata algarum TaxID=2975278 RepID=A0ABU5F144_9BACT|nr:hypothetical protein [Gemmata algarum]
MAWDWIEGAPVDGDARTALHRKCERLGKRNAPNRGGRLELYETANAATFILGVVINPINVRYAGVLRHTVPNVLKALFPHDYQSRCEVEQAWQAAATAHLAAIDAPSRNCFADL